MVLRSLSDPTKIATDFICFGSLRILLMFWANFVCSAGPNSWLCALYQPPNPGASQ